MSTAAVLAAVLAILKTVADWINQADARWRRVREVRDATEAGEEKAEAARVQATHERIDREPERKRDELLERLKKRGTKAVPLLALVLLAGCASIRRDVATLVCSECVQSVSEPRLLLFPEWPAELSWYPDPQSEDGLCLPGKDADRLDKFADKFEATKSARRRLTQ